MSEIRLKSFLMYNTFYEAAEHLSDSEFREAVLKLRDYALYHDETPANSKAVAMLLEMFKEPTDAARERYENCIRNGNKGKNYGWLGGRPRKDGQKPQRKPQEKPLNVNEDVDVYGNRNIKEKENRNFYDKVDVYADGNVEVDVNDEVEVYLDEEEEPIQGDSSNGLGDYLETLEPITNPDYYQQDREPQPEREDIAFSNKPNPILPTNRQELLRVYEENLNLLQKYDVNHWDFDSQSKESLRLATLALMKINNISFEQAKEHIAAVRSQLRQDNG